MDYSSSKRVFVDALNNLADNVTDSTGLNVVTIAVAFDDHLETLAVTGGLGASERNLGHVTPVVDMEKVFAGADVCAGLYLVRSHTLGRSDVHLILAPIVDERARLRSVVAAEVPSEGEPDLTRIAEQLKRHVPEIKRTVLYALERVDLDEQVRMTRAVRRVVREASSELSVAKIIDYCQSALTQTFDASGLWIQTFEDGKDDQGALYAATGAEIHLKEDLRAVARPAARMLWDAQTVVEIAETAPRSAALTMQEEQRIFEFMRTIGVTSLLFVPLGAGRECLGNLVLTRQGQPRPWTDLEKHTALDIGHDLGRALLNARAFERERRLVDELIELDSYKSRLIATLAHELKNPLTSVLGHMEMLESSPDLGPRGRQSIEAVERSAGRMQRLIDDLLTLGSISDPASPFTPTPVDMRAVLADVVDLVKLQVQRKGLHVDLVAPPGPVMVHGEVAGLDRLLGNLLSNAVKYTPDGGRVRITMSYADDMTTVQVADTGLGISEDDQKKLFTEFFRSTNPEARKMPGTGLGLAIALTIVQRHGGTMQCHSVLGEGTTFTFTLPQPPSREA